MIKGKGMMRTYFLYTNGDITIDKPDPPNEEKNGSNTTKEAKNEEAKQNVKNGTAEKGDTKTFDDVVLHQSINAVDMQNCTSKTCDLM